MSLLLGHRLAVQVLALAAAALAYHHIMLPAPPGRLEVAAVDATALLALARRLLLHRHLELAVERHWRARIFRT